MREARDDAYWMARFLAWRGVEEPCPMCHGSGARLYSSTATWRGGLGGAALRTDVCDTCWGTGDAQRKGVDLRADRREVRAETVREIVEKAKAAVRASFPDNWLDPMLTGPSRVLYGKNDCRDIEAVVGACSVRALSALDALLKEE